MNELYRKPVRMSVLSVPCHLRVVRGAVERMCEQAGLDDAAASGVVLAVDEAMTNIIRHAYAGAADMPIELEMAIVGPGRPQRLRISLRDYGRQVAAIQTKGRGLAELRPGGLGVHIISECMDRVEYCRASSGGTLLVLEKKLTEPCLGDPE